MHRFFSLKSRLSWHCRRLAAFAGLAGLLISAPLSAEESATRFLERSSGQVEYRGVTYRDFGAYLRSSQFQLDGKRCGIEPYLQSRAGNFRLADPDAARSVSDCTAALTAIQNEYWPTKLEYEIPVWFHVISTSAGLGHISTARINAQITVLNEDFRAISNTLGSSGFDVKIQFRLAGISRTTNDGWYTDSAADEIAYKTALGKDPTQYLNIYTNDADGYLGYATIPQFSAGSALDGVVLRHEVVSGRNSTTIARYNMGRTAVHEIGHYLGLYHTFQGINGYCANSFSSGDLITDTNAQSAPHYGCGAQTSCGSPDPTDNYMDYSDDACMNRFTAQQANRMVCSLVNYRPGLPRLIRDGSGHLLPPILKLLLLDD